MCKTKTALSKYNGSYLCGLHEKQQTTKIVLKTSNKVLIYYYFIKVICLCGHLVPVDLLDYQKFSR